MKEIILTQQEKVELENRLNELKNELIPAVVQRISIAKEQGDLSENAEYKSAREQKDVLDSEVSRIEEQLKYGKVAIVTKSDTVGIGATVTYVEEANGKEYTFTIVGTTGANVLAGKISNVSPIGKALMGKRVDAVCDVVPPKGGVYKIRITNLKY